MTGEPRYWMVSYDIADDSRRSRIYRILRGFGDHLQYSVFRCLITDRQFAELKAALLDVVQHDVDQVLLIPLGGEESRAVQGMLTLGVALTQPERVVIVL